MSHGGIKIQGITADYLMGTLLYGYKVGGNYMEDRASHFLKISLDLEFLPKGSVKESSI